MNPSFSTSFRMLLAALLLAAFLPAQAQIVKPRSIRDGGSEKFIKPDGLQWLNAPLEQILDEYSDITGMTYLLDPAVPQVNISFRAQNELSETEVLVAIETLLTMNNIALIPFGDSGKFLKVLPTANTQTAGGPLELEPPKGPLPINDQMRHQLIKLKHIELASVQAIVQQLLHPNFGKLSPLEQINGFLVNDTAANIQRVLELLAELDVEDVTREELFTYTIKFAEAPEIAAKLNELIAESQEELRRRNTSSSSRGSSSSARSTTSSRIASLRSSTPGSTPRPSTDITPGEVAKRGIVQGRVQIVADERSNILLITTQPVNTNFFDRIIDLLDVPVEPDLAVKLLSLEFAQAVETAGILNELIGAATSNQTTPGQNQRPGTTPGTTASRTTPGSTASRGSSLADIVASRTNRQSGGAAGLSSPALNNLSESTRILADERTNSLLLLGKTDDITLLEDVVGQLDVMLAQVMIEAIILEVQLGDNLDYGIDWLQRSMTGLREETLGPNGALSVSEPIWSLGSGQRVTSDGGAFIDGSQVNRATEFGSGLSLFGTLYDFNVDVIVRLAAGSSEATVKSSPVVLTTDNTEAKITVAEQRPIPTTTSTTLGGSIRSTFEYRDIGIVLTVTPNISPTGMVSMEIVQSSDNVGGEVVIDNNNVPIITRRELQANITVSNRTTIVLGGLVSEDDRDTTTKVPVLGDIPGLGNLFRSKSRSNSRTELLVFITPYVLMSPEDAMAETRRIKNASESGDDDKWNRRGWSDSEIMQYEGRRDRGRANLERNRKRNDYVIEDRKELETRRKLTAAAGAPVPRDMGKLPDVEPAPGAFVPLPPAPEEESYRAPPGQPSPLQAPRIDPPEPAPLEPVPTPPAPLFPPRPAPESTPLAPPVSSSEVPSESPSARTLLDASTFPVTPAPVREPPEPVLTSRPAPEPPSGKLGAPVRLEPVAPVAEPRRPLRDEIPPEVLSELFKPVPSGRPAVDESAAVEVIPAPKPVAAPPKVDAGEEKVRKGLLGRLFSKRDQQGEPAPERVQEPIVVTTPRGGSGLENTNLFKVLPSIKPPPAPLKRVSSSDVPTLLE